MLVEQTHNTPCREETDPWVHSWQSSPRGCETRPIQLNAAVPEESRFLHTVRQALLTARLSGPQAKENMQPAASLTLLSMRCQVIDTVCPHRTAGLQRGEHSPRGTSRITTTASTYGIFSVVLAITALLPRRHSLGYNFPKHTFGSFNDRKSRASSET